MKGSVADDAGEVSFSPEAELIQILSSEAYTTESTEYRPTNSSRAYNNRD